MMILFWLGAVLLIHYLFQKGKFKAPVGKNSETILTERYVKGEIDEATYLKMKETIKG